jgi:formamidopyrimidine-DNA glycosylase
MFELPEYVTLARQMNRALRGKTIERGQLGNSPHKFVWYNRGHDEFEALTAGRTIGEARTRGRWLFVGLDPGYVLLLGECGGKMMYHEPRSKLPKKYHLHLQFDDDSFFTVTTQMWGAMELHERGKELEREYVKDMRPTPTEPEFTSDYLSGLIDETTVAGKRSVKGLLTQEQLIPGLGNAIAQDIMFGARLHPKTPIDSLREEQRRGLHESIVGTVAQVIDAGGRYDEFDLFGNPGGYVRLMDKNSLSRPCPGCEGEVVKIQYLGGACYFCPSCQPD